MSPHLDELLTRRFSCGLDYEFWPAVATGSNKLMIVLHGRGDSGEGFHWLPEALNIDELNFLFLNAPDTYGPGFSWYDLPPNQAPGVQSSRTLLTDLVDNLESEIALNCSNIFLFGFSQGCLQSLDLALRYPKMFAGVIGVSGYVYFLNEYPKAFSAMARSQRILITHGRQDEMLAISETRPSIMALKEMGIHIDWQEYDKEHTIDPNLEMNEIRTFVRRILDLA